MILKLYDTFEGVFTVKKETHEGFINVFKDNNPLHTDMEFARKKGFEGVVMHGNILNGFLSFFIGERLPTKDVIIHSQEIQFKHPVYLNDELQFNAEIVGVYESVKAIEFKYSFKNKGKKIVAKGKIQIGLII
ncbi:MaoC family dehydratase [Arenibacter palladensis]|uniref:MaoC family dehydratase n=1 Tax=Arenibacter palladensis TaxID=237373 RepID=UPI0026E4484A|nr:MaoC family dehydratase [Arenibacter palladensis]MDO6605135.1 MaoC family dehydratase [Arenibacter palladensis]